MGGGAGAIEVYLVSAGRVGEEGDGAAVYIADG